MSSIEERIAAAEKRLKAKEQNGRSTSVTDRIAAAEAKYGVSTKPLTQTWKQGNEEELFSSSAAAKAEREKIRNRLETVKGIVPSVPKKEVVVDRKEDLDAMREELNRVFWDKNLAFFTGNDYAGKKDAYESLKAEVAELSAQDAAQSESEDNGFLAKYFKDIEFLPDSLEGLGKGLAYNAERAAAGALGFGEGITDFLGTAFYKGIEGLTSGFGLAPNAVSEWAGNAAESFLDNSVTDRYNESIRLRYNPTEGEEAWGGLTQGTADVLTSLATGKAAANAAAGGAQLLDDAAKAAREANIVKGGFGLSASGRGAKEAYDEGATTGEALTYGAASGMAEVLIESLAGGIPGMGEGKLSQVVKKVVDNPAVNGLLDVMGEGGEEALSAVISPFLKRAVYDPDAEMASWEEIGESAVLGALTSLGLQGLSVPGAVSGVVSRAKADAEYRRQIADLVQNAAAQQSSSETDVAPAQLEQTINGIDTTSAQSEQTRLSNKQVERMIRNQATMQEMGVDTNGKTMSQLRGEVRAALAAQQQGAVTSSEESRVQTPAQETAPTASPVVSQEETARRMSVGEVATAVLGENGAKAFRTAYNQDVASRVDEKTATTGFNTVYKATLDGRTMTAEERAQTASLPEGMRMAAESSARLDRQRASQAKYFGENAGVVRDNGFKQMHLSSKTVRTLDAAAKVAGVQVQFAEDVEGGEASYQDGVIRISTKSKDPVMTLFTHEIVHRIRETSPQSYNAMAEFVQKYMSETAKTVNALAYASTYETSDVSFYTEEMVADAFGTILQDGKAMERFVQDNRTVAQKVLDAIRDFVNAIKRAMNRQNVELSAEQRKDFLDLESKFSEMEKIMESSLKSVPAVEKENAAPEGSEIRFSTKNEVLALGNVDWMDNFSSIKDQLTKHVDEINNMEPVAVVEYSPKSNDNIKSVIADVVAHVGGKSMKNGGVRFLFDDEGIAKIDVHAREEEVRAASLASPYVAKYGKLIAGQKNHENKGLTTLTFAAPVIINGDTVNVGVAIQFTSDGRPRAANVGLQSGGVFKIDKTKAPKGPGSRVSRYDQGTALPTMDAFKGSVTQPSSAVNPESGRQSKRIDPETRREAEESVARYVEQYGAIPPGENPARVIELPRRTERDNKVSQTVRTILEAQATPDEMVPDIEKLVADGKLSYNPISDESAVSEATAYIERVSWDQAQRDWFTDVKNGVVSKANTTLGWLLYNNAANEGNTKLAIDILNEMVKSQRNAAQALQATRILKTLSPETQLYGAQKSVEGLTAELKKRYGDDIPDLKINPALAEKFLRATTDKGRVEAMQEIYRDIGRQMPSRFIDKFNAWSYLAMLGNFRTHVRNIVGNAGFAPVVAVKNLTAAGIERLVLRNRDSRTKSIALATKEGRALLKAAWADYSNVMDSMPDGKYSDLKNANKYIEEGRVIFGRGEGKTAFGRVLSNSVGKLTEKARRFNSGALAYEDMWFSKPHYASALAQYCKAHGISVEELQRGKTKRLDTARNYAMREAQKATYQDANDFSKYFSRLGRNGSDTKTGRVVNRLIEGVLPFRKTPANILVRSVEYSPLGLVRGLKNAVFDVRKGKVTAAEAIDHISASLTGTALLGLGYLLAKFGLVRGRGDEDGKERDIAELQGHQSYALELPDGTSATLDWLAPEALPFFIGVNLFESLGDGDGMTADDWVNSLSGITEPLLEMSCLQGLNALFDEVGYASSEELDPLPKVAISAATGLLTRVVPTLFGQIERSYEPTRMATYTDKNNTKVTQDMQYFLGRLSAKIPGLDYNQIPYIDAWGREEASGGPFERAFNNFLNPAYMSEVNTSEMERELERLYSSVGETEILPSRAPKSFTVDGVDIDLTAEQYVEYATFRGQRAYELLRELTESKRYSGLDDKLKASAVKKCYSVANEEAKALVSDFSLGKFHQSMDKAEGAGISGSDYILFYVTVSELKQDQVRAWLNKSGYTRKQKEVLWSTKYSSAY